jgi:hypothetical protein
MHDAGGDEAQSRSAEALVLDGSVSDVAAAMQGHRPPKRVARLAVVESCVIALS